MKMLASPSRFIAALLVLALPLQAAHYKLFVLTGQSNSLGTTAGGESDPTPGSDPADQQIKFYWHNLADATTSLGDSGGAFTNLTSQQGGYYAGSATHWGPEMWFGRTLYRAGVRNFGIIKASRGGGGNSYWLKTSTDNHMYTNVVNTVTNATAVLTAQGHTFEIVGLLYLQGESDNTTEAAEAGTRFKTLVDNLRNDLPNATNLFGVIGGIAAAGTTRDTVRANQQAIAASTSYIDYFSNLDLQPQLYDSLHFNKAAKITVGERYAQTFFANGIVSRNYGKLVFIGDSITQGGNGDHPSYRYKVFSHLASKGVPINPTNGYQFTGSVTGPYLNSTLTTPNVNSQVFSNFHDGHWGWRVSWECARVALPAGRYNVNNLGNGTLLNWTGQTTTYVTADAGTLTYTGATYTPDTVSILIGINDLADGTAETQVRDDIGTLINQLRAANSSVRVFLNKVLHTNQGEPRNTQVNTLNGLLPALVAAKNAANTNSPVWLVDADTGFNPATMTYDNIHPNTVGEPYVGDRIAAALGLIETPAPGVSGMALYWDGGAANISGNGDGVSQGGSGTWNTTLTNWDAGNGVPHTIWVNTATAVFGGAGGTVTLGSAITCGGILNAAAGDISLPGAYNLTINGPLDTGTNRNLTIGNADGGTVNLSAATLTGTTTLTVSKTASTATSSFNVTNGLSFNGTLALRGGVVSAAPGTMGGLFLWLNAPSGIQAANTSFALDTGASSANGMDIVLGDWDATSGNRRLTLSSLSGYGTIRTDAGAAGTRNLIVNQAGNTTFNGMLLSHTSSAGVVRSLSFEKRGDGSLTMANIIGKETASSGSANSPVSIAVTAGTLVLAGTNTTTGATTVNGGKLVVNGIHPSTSAITVGSGGTLGGTGLINGAVSVAGTLSPGTSIGTLTLASSPTLSGTVLMEINRTNSPSADKLVVSNSLAYGGSLTVANVGPGSLAAGDTFVLFNATGYSGSFAATNLPLLAPGLGWRWTATNGTLSVIQTFNAGPTNLTSSYSNNQLNLSWPADRLGWVLQSQTNSLGVGLSTNWFDVPGSGLVTNFSFNINPTNPTVFYRLRGPVRLAFQEDWSSSSIDPAKWYMLRKKWGTGNNGVTPTNVWIGTDVVNGTPQNVLICEAHGDQYSGPVTGYGGQTTRVGGVIVTREFFASGRYEVVMKVGAPSGLSTPAGAVPAIWNYAYRWVQTSVANQDNFDPGVPLYNPLLKVSGSPATEYWSEIDYPELGSSGDFTHGGYNVFCQNKYDWQTYAVPPIMDGQYHTYVMEWHTQLKPLTNVTDAQVIAYNGYWWVQDKTIPIASYLGNPLKRLGPDSYAACTGLTTQNWLDGNPIGGNTSYVPCMASQLTFGVWLPGWGGAAPWQTAQVSFGPIKIWQYDDPGDVRGILTEDVPPNF